MRTVLSGEISFLSLREFVQLLLRPGVSGTARISASGLVVELLFDDGHFLAARANRSETWETGGDSISRILSGVLSWAGARFELDTDAVSSFPSPKPLDLAGLLTMAEGLHRELSIRASDPSTLFRRMAAAIGVSAGSRPITLTSIALQLLIAMDGDISAADAGARAAIDPSDLQSAMVELQSQGLIECADKTLRQPTAPMESIPAAPKTRVAPLPITAPIAPIVAPRVEAARPAGLKPDTTTDDEEEITAAALTLHDDARTLYPLFDDSYSLGRDPGSAIVIPHASISSRHAILTRGPRGYTVEDLGSRNGTFVNGEPVKNRLLRDGDELRVGKVLITYSVASELKRQKTLSNVPIPK